MNRRPPESVKRELRKEVGFCCPVQGCDLPYLEWHHFDPPWSKKEHHDPIGMVALCRQHHIEADNGAFTLEQLRAFKEIPASEHSRASGKLNWMRHKLLGFIGGTFYEDVQTILKIGEEKIIWFERDSEGFILLNLTLPTTNGPLAIMRDNEWQNHFIEEDIVCPPSSKKILIRYPENQHIEVMFFEVDSHDSLIKLNPKAEQFIDNISVPVTVVEVAYKIGDIEFSSKKDVSIGTNKFSIGIVSGASVVFQL